METKPQKRFGGIMSLFIKEEFVGTDSGLQNNAPANVPSAVTAALQPRPVIVNISQPIKGADVNEYVQKMHDLLQQLNKPEIDFIDLWNSAEVLGDVNLQNLQSAFRVLQAGAKGQFTVDSMLQSGEYYKKELTRQIDSEVSGKRKKSEQLTGQKNSERMQLEQEVDDIEKQIANLQKQLGEQKQNLQSIDGKYDSEIAQIDTKISAGVTALGMVNTEMDTILTLIKQIKNS